LDLSPSLTYHLTFSNCIFLGFDHALTSSHPSLRLTLSDCVFKHQSRASLLATDAHLLLTASTFTKGCGSASMVTLLGGDSNVTINDCVFKKSQGGAVHIEGGECVMRGTQVR
jgi:hypothetical protein